MVENILHYYDLMLELIMELKLTISLGSLGATDICNPSVEQIIRSLKEVATPDDSFIILSYSDKLFMQTDGYVIECQMGSLEQHYYLPSRFQSPYFAAQFFLSFADPHDDWWKKGARWEKGMDGGD